MGTSIAGLVEAERVAVFVVVAVGIVAVDAGRGAAPDAYNEVLAVGVGGHHELFVGGVDEFLDSLVLGIGGGAERRVDVRALVVQVDAADDAAVFEDGVSLGVGRAAGVRLPR